MKQTKKKKTKKKYELRRLTLGVGLFVLAGALLLFAYSSPLSTKHETGQLNNNETHSGEALRQSLDINTAAKATYPSLPISVYKDVDNQGTAKEQVIRFAVPADNLNEFALLIEPTSPAPAAGYPVIILSHGYVNPSDYTTTIGYLPDMEFYARNGFAVIKPDYRGQGLSVHEGTANSAYYSMDYNTDLMSLISAIKQTKGLDKNNINLWGHSMGAYISLRASVLSKDIKHTILLSGPISSLNQMYLDYIPPSDENNPYALKTRAQVFSKYGTPGENTQFWKDASAINFLSNTAVKYQIHVGEQDEVVPPIFSSQLNDKLNSIKRVHEYYTYDQAGHSLFPQRPLIWSRSLSFLKQNG